MNAEEDVTVTTEDATKRSSDRRWRLMCAGLAGMLIAAIVGCVLLWRDGADLEGRADADRAAARKAERIVVTWLTYDYRTYSDDLSWVTESGTDKFRKEYSSAALEGMRERIVGPRQLISRGRVVNSAATASDADHVKVLIFTDQTITDKDIRKRGGTPLHARSGVELSMVRDGDRWLVDEMVQLQFQ
jgi:hypothetical protein